MHEQTYSSLYNVCGDEIMVKHKLVYFGNMIIMVEKMNPFPIMLIPLYSFFFFKERQHQSFLFFNIKEGDL